MYITTEDSQIVPYDKIVRIGTKGRFFHDLLGKLHRASREEIEKYIAFLNK